MLNEMAINHHVARCHFCGKASQILPSPEQTVAHCARCDSHISFRIKNSISNTWALLATAIILLIPANLLPVMSVIMLGNGESDTIMSGIIHLMQAKQYPIALLVFVASILVPLFKIASLAALLITIQNKWRINRRQASRIFRIVRFIGPWSMLDLFMISILVTLVKLGFVATIVTGPGATAFAGVVVVTMLAAHTFDQRLIWDLLEKDGE